MAKAFNARAMSRFMTESGVKAGSVRDATINKGSEEFMQWLVRETPEGATLCDLLVTFAIDAYHDEMDGLRRKQ